MVTAVSRRTLYISTTRSSLMRGLSVWTAVGWDRAQCGFLAGKVEALHGTQVVDRACRLSVSRFHDVCGCQEAVPRTCKRGVAVGVSKEEVCACEGKKSRKFKVCVSLLNWYI